MCPSHWSQLPASLRDVLSAPEAERADNYESIAQAAISQVAHQQRRHRRPAGRVTKPVQLALF